MKQKNNLLASRLTENRVRDTEETVPEQDEETNVKKMAEFFEVTDSSILNEKELEAHEETEKNAGAGTIHTRILNGLLIAGCLYLVFLIFGVFVTQYHYTEDGTVSAQRMSVADIRAKKTYSDMLAQYQYCRLLYEKTLMLDYRIASGEEDPLKIAPEYEALLDDVTNLSVKTDAMAVDTQYAQLKEMLLTWIKDDIAVYLQNMSSSISQNNMETANNALQDRDRVYNDFSLITQNIIAAGEDIPGVELKDIKTWTPESYIEKEIHGK